MEFSEYSIWYIKKFMLVGGVCFDVMILERERSENKEIPVGEYISDVLLVGVSLGRAPTSTEYEERGRFSETSGRRKFGSWDNTLGMVCAETFDLKPPYEYMLERAKEVGVTENMAAGAFRWRVDFSCHVHDWWAMKEDLGVKEREERRSEKEVISEFKIYRENCYEEEESSGFISDMSDSLKTPPQEYRRHFVSIHEAEVMAGYCEHYRGKYGRGTRDKLDDLLKLTDEYMCTEWSSSMENPWVLNVVKNIQNNLPDKFFEDGGVVFK